MIYRDNILIVLPFVCLLFLGIVMVASSSVFVAEKMFGNPFHFASRQIIFMCIGIFALVVAVSIPSNLFYIKRWPKNYDLQGWTVFLSDQGMQKSHNHLSGWMSGIIYLQIPEEKNNNKEGSIEFSLHGYSYPTKRLDFPIKQFIFFSKLNLADEKLL